MAIYHLTVKPIGRRQGKKAVACAAYRRATLLKDEGSGLSFDYRAKRGVVHTELIAPENAPQWAKDLVRLHEENKDSAAELLWNKVEQREKRVDSRLAREFEFSLPIELTQEQSIILAREFIKDQLAAHGMICDWNVHWDEGNPHVHVLVTLRHLTEDGFGKCAREWNATDFTVKLRRHWSEYANYHLLLNKHDVRIDHRSYKDQGIGLIPSVHKGKAVTDMERRGINTEIHQKAIRIQRQNLGIIASQPEVLLKKVSSTQSAFTANQIVDELGRYIGDRQGFKSTHSAYEANSDNAYSQLHAKALLAKMQKEEKAEKRDLGTLPEGPLTAEVILKVLQAVEKNEAVFAEQELAKALLPYTDNGELFSKALLQIKSSEELLPLGVGDDGREKYTTRYIFKTENEAQQIAEQLGQKKHTKISTSAIKTALSNYAKRTGKQLTEEQLKAVKHITAKQSLACVVGHAGTGKSFLLGAAKEIWESQGLKVSGIALAGIAAEGLSREAGIPSRTIESFKWALENKKLVLTEKDVLVMDEAGMTDLHSMLTVLKAVQAAKAKVVLVGDTEQLQPVGPGAIFRAILELLPAATLKTVYRQKVEWQREASVLMSQGDITEGIERYAKRGHVHFAEDAEGAMVQLVAHWQKLRLEKPESSVGDYLVLAFKNEEVDALNQKLRETRIAAGEIAPGYKVYSKAGVIEIAKDDRLLFLKNDSRFGVKNGDFATIESVNFTETGEVLSFVVKIDGKEESLAIDPERYRDFTYGYAATVHKAQGLTVDHTLSYKGNGRWSRFLAYVSMTRHRYGLDIFTDRKTHPDLDSLKRSMGRTSLKDNVMDFPLAFAERRGLYPQDDKRLLVHLAQRLGGITSKLASHYEEIVHPKRYWEKKTQAAEKLQAKEAQQARRNYSKIVGDYANANCAVGIASEILKLKLAALGLEKIPYGTSEFELVATLPEYQDLQKKLAVRDALAFAVDKDRNNHLKALDTLAIDLGKLETQAKLHQVHLKVKEYQGLVQSEKFVLRDRVAFEMLKEIKRYYPALKKQGLAEGVQSQGIAHLRRELFIKLTAKERQSFKVVERYLELGKLYGERIKPLPTELLKDGKGKEVSYLKLRHQTEEKLKDILKEREQLAALILKDKIKYRKALDFYQVGKAKPRWEGEVISSKSLPFIKERGQKLSQQLEMVKRQERVAAYLRAKDQNNEKAQIQLAKLFMSNMSHYHVAIFRTVHSKDEVKALWKSIRHDAQVLANKEYFKGLTEKGQAAYLQVEAYAEAQKAYSNVWKEIFNAKGEQKLTDVELNEKLKPFVEPYTRLRDQLAMGIKQGDLDYQATFKFFSIDSEKLDKAAVAGLCRQDVENYCAEKNLLARAKFAKAITADPKAHWGAMVEQNLSWKAVYKDIWIAERAEKYRSLSQEEKQLLRAAKAYRKVNRLVGKNYGVLKGLEEKSAAYIQQQEKLNLLSAQRDYLAKNLIDKKETVEFSLLFEADPTFDLSELEVFKSLNRQKFDLEKIGKQAEKHSDRLKTVKAWQEEESFSVRQLKKLMSADKKGEIPKDLELNSDAYEFWLSEAGELKNLQQTILKNRHKYEYALKEAGSSEHAFIEQVASLKQLEQNLALQSRISSQGTAEVLSTPNEHQLEKIAKARKIAGETKPIAGTIAERYLREVRGIKGPLPDSYRYHSRLYNHLAKGKFPSLVVIAHNEKSQVQAVQAIALDPETAQKAVGKNSKLTYGVLSQNRQLGVLVNRGKSTQSIVVAEGPETALSVREALPNHRIYAVLGSSNFARVPTSKNTKTIVFAADNDGLNSTSSKKLKELAQQFAEQGKDVYQVMPKGEKQDFNDVLLKEGVAAVKEAFKAPELLAEKVTPKDLKQKTNRYARKIAESYQSKTPPEDLKNYWAKIHIESKPTKGTLAEAYLEKLGIGGQRLKEVKYHPGVWCQEAKAYLPGLVCRVVGSEETTAPVKGIHVTYLDRLTGDKAKLEHPTKYFGEKSGLVSLQVPKEGKFGWFVALDVETALTLTKVTKKQAVYFMPELNGIEKMPFKGQEKAMVLCLNEQVSQVKLTKTISDFKDHGYRVFLSQPGKHKNLNDLYKAGGRDAVVKALKDRVDTEVKVLDKVKLANELIAYMDAKDLQYELTIAVHSQTFASHELEEAAWKKALDQGKAVKNMAKEIAATVKDFIDLRKINHHDLPKLEDLGGEKAIKRRLAKGVIRENDIKTVLLEVRADANKLSFAEAQKQSQGGGRKV